MNYASDVQETFEHKRLTCRVYATYNLDQIIELVCINNGKEEICFKLADYDDSDKLHQKALFTLYQALHKEIDEDELIDEWVPQPWPTTFLERFALSGDMK